jgi:hypothetical protein
MQHESHPQHRSRVVAANNILNALFMVVSALMTVWLLKLGFNSPEIFLCTGLSSTVVTSLLFWIQPEFMRDFQRWIRSNR